MRELVAALGVATSLSFGGFGWGCGGAQHDHSAREAQAFSCRGRAARYVAIHHLAGDELGVQIDCAPAGPRIMRWRVDKAGTRQEDTRGATPGEFDKIWRELDATGWPNLRDCTSGTAGKQDPIYMFDIQDDQNHASFQCQSQSMPYPYNDLVDPLDLAAQMGRGQLGDDEPAAAKALDRNGKAKPATQNDARSGVKPGVEPGAKPGTKPGAKPGAKPGTKPGVKIDDKTGDKTR
jgi:hypothetical protein